MLHFDRPPEQNVAQHAAVHSSAREFAFGGPGGALGL